MAYAILREPLAHFLIAGFAVFLFSAWRDDPVDPASRAITIDEVQVARLSAGWERTWRRPPSKREIDALIRDHIKEEIYYREAQRLGLDQDDSVIRRRLRSKMEYLATAQVESAMPGDAILAAWLARYPARFATDAAYSFDHIYLGRDENHRAVSSAIAAGADWATQGEAISLPKSVDNERTSEIERQFGADFAASVTALPPGRWAGPVKSGFGQHLVRVRAMRLPSAPKLAEVRQAVENDWRAATLKQREAQAYQALLDSYTIRIAVP
jgi:peptidyl-prolyl cis-trans isomerase C